VAGAICLAIAYLSALPRGPYIDDYVSEGFRLALGPRAVGVAFDEALARGLTYSPLAIHVALALLVGLNALLLGALVRRVSGSNFAGLAAGWLFVAPPLAFEATLWISASHYVLGTTFLLVYLHRNVGSQNEHPFGRFAISSSVLVLTLLTSEQAMVVALLSAPFLHVLRHQEGTRRLLYQLWGPLLVTSLVGVLTYFGPLGGSAELSAASRGGLDLHPSAVLEQSLQLLIRLNWMTISHAWGAALFWSALATAWTASVGTVGGVLILLVALLAVAGAARHWVVGSAARDRWSPRHPTVAIAWAVLWATGALLLPDVLLRNQQLEYRMLYLPSAGAAAGVALVVARVLERQSWRALMVVAVLSAGTAMVVSSLTVAGFARAFQLRSERDMHEVRSLSSIPSSALPSNAVVVPFATEPSLSSARSTLDVLLAGGFETPWSSHALIYLAVHRRDLKPVTMNRWAGMRFDYTRGAKQISVQGANAPLDRILVFTFDGSKMVVIERIVLQSPSGSLTFVELPLGERMASIGIPAESVKVETGTPVFSVTVAR
jgi:hypothetical protein